MLGTDLDLLKARFLAAQLGGQRREALRLIIEDGLGRGATVSALRRDVISAAQQHIGVLWQENRISVADEHMATAISQLALAHLYQHAPVVRPHGKKVMVACVEGELHDFPARMVTDALDLAGFEVRFLGANVPVEHLVRAVEQHRPDLLALSVTMSFNVPAARAAIEQVRARIKDQRIALGGNACRFSADLPNELRADASASDADELVEIVRKLLEVTP